MQLLLSKTRSFIIHNKFPVLLISLLLISTLLRFNHFSTHWGLGNDDARDLSIAKEALKRKELPLIGSFSSAGPFVFGPIFYWIIMLSLILFPFTFTAPWILTGIFGILTVLILTYCGKILGGNRLAALTGIYAATSPQLIIRSLALGQHSYVAFAASLLLLSTILLWKRQRSIYAFSMGASIGIAISMHYQALNLLLFLPVSFLIPQTSLRKKLFFSLAQFLGLLIPSLPLIIWDYPQHFANLRNILDYFLIGQYRFYVPNSWKLFLFQTFPAYWSFVIGGQKVLGFLLMIVSALTLSWYFFRRQLPTLITIFSALFFTLFIINRYYKGERSEGYLLYFLPLILLLTTYSLYLLINSSFKNRKLQIISRLAAILLSVSILIGNTMAYLSYLSYKSPATAFQQEVKVLIKKYPHTKFSVYDYKGHYSYHSQPLSLLLEKEGKISKEGLAIGFSCNLKCGQPYPEIATLNGLPLLDLSSVKNISQNKEWINVNQSNMYDDLIGWSKKHELKSNFSINYFHGVINWK